MRYLILTLLLLNCLSCTGSRTNYPPIIQIETDFIPYYRNFINEGFKYGQDYTRASIVIVYGLPNIRYGDRNLALCSTPSDPINSLAPIVPIVRVDNELWHSIPDYMKEETIFHELGHCVLGRHHDSLLDQYGQPADIMFPVSTFVYAYKKEQYVRELFNP